jgi:hypothetical protein
MDWSKTVTEQLEKYSLDESSAALSAGDNVALLSSMADEREVTRATLPALQAPGGTFGMVLQTHAPGATNVQVAVAGTVPARISGLSPDTVGAVLIADGRAARAPKLLGAATARWSGDGYLGGSIDYNGKVTIGCVGREATMPCHELNVLDLGDAEFRFGFKAGPDGAALATDNLPAFNAAVDAIQATGTPGGLRIPTGTYYLCDRWLVSATVPIEIVGDSDDYFADNRLTNLVWPRFNFISGAAPKVARINIATPAGPLIRDLNVWQPLADAVPPWSSQKARGGAFTFKTNVIPDERSFGVIYHCTLPAPGVLPGDSHTPSPKEIDTARRFDVGNLIYVPFIVDSLNPDNEVYRYKVVAATSDQTTDFARKLRRYTGSAEPFVTDAHHDANLPPVPSTVWTGSFFTVDSGNGTVTIEPKSSWLASEEILRQMGNGPSQQNDTITLGGSAVNDDYAGGGGATSKETNAVEYQCLETESSLLILGSDQTPDDLLEINAFDIRDTLRQRGPAHARSR